MKIFITGGVGFVGRCLSQTLLDQGHQVTAVALRSSQNVIQHPRFRYISADTTQPGAWQAALADMDAVVNLAGKSIAGRWSKRYKQLVYDSRILTTRNLVQALSRPEVSTLLSASGVGYYGNTGEAVVTEAAPRGQDFLSRVAGDWETEAFQAEDSGVRVVAARFGVVLGRGGGAMEKMLPAFRAFMGGALGAGRQWFPWIHIDDLVSAIVFVLENEGFAGPANFCAPQAVRNSEFAEILGRVLNRPAVMPAPAFMLRLTLGEFAETLLGGQKTHPDTLLKHGFKFRFPTLQKALEDIVQP